MRLESLQGAALVGEAPTAFFRTIHAFPALPVREIAPAGWRWSDFHEADVIVAFDRFEALGDIVRREGRLLTPLLATSEAAPPWYDVRGPGAAAEEGLLKADAILERLHDLALPENPAPELTLLARLHSRGTALTACYAPHTRDMVWHPAAGVMDGVAETANRLAHQGLLHATFFDRILCCTQCGGGRLLAREECVSCRSTDITEQVLVHHFRCGHEAPEARFKAGPRLECPKCNRELRHIGVDYDKPGSVIVCRRCAAMNDSPAVGFMCADCLTHHDSAAVPQRDWHHYEITPAGLRALREGRTTTSDIAPAHETLRIIVDHAVREKAHFHKPFQLVRVTFAAADAIRRRSMRDWTHAHALALEATRSAVREVDRVAGLENGALVFLAGLSGREARKAVAAIEKRLQEVVTEPLAPEHHLLDDGEVHAWLRDNRA